MKRFNLIMAFLLIFIGSGCSLDDSRESIELKPNHLTGIPFNAVLIDHFPVSNGNGFDGFYEVHWVQWEYKGVCYMSKALETKTASITDIPCPADIDYTKRIQNRIIMYVKQ